MVFKCPNIQAHYNEAVIYLNFGTPKNNEFSIWNKWKIYYFQVSQYLSTLGYPQYPSYLELYIKDTVTLNCLHFQEGLVSINQLWEGYPHSELS